MRRGGAAAVLFGRSPAGLLRSPARSPALLPACSPALKAPARDPYSRDSAPGGRFSVVTGPIRPFTQDLRLDGPGPLHKAPGAEHYQRPPTSGRQGSREAVLTTPMRPRGSLIPAADALAPDFSSYRITVGLLGLNWRPAPGPRWSRAGGGHVRAVVTGGNGRTHDPYLRSGCHRGRSRCVRGPNLASCASLATVWGVIPWIRRPKQPITDGGADRSADGGADRSADRSADRRHLDGRLRHLVR